jgi:Rrf2 family transcriptional regulator, cysteine metabolism repressor
MKLSTRSRYGVRLMLELAINYNKGPVQLSMISDVEEISEKYLGQIVIQLKNAGLINSVRGAQGGYLLSGKPDKITLRNIVESLEGSLNLVDCIDDKGLCSRNEICVTKDVWELISDNIKNTLENITLANLVEKTKGKINSSNYLI